MKYEIKYGWEGAGRDDFLDIIEAATAKDALEMSWENQVARLLEVGRLAITLIIRSIRWIPDAAPEMAVATLDRNAMSDGELIARTISAFAESVDTLTREVLILLGQSSCTTLDRVTRRSSRSNSSTFAPQMASE